MDGCSIKQYMITVADCTKIFELKIKSRPVNAGPLQVSTLLSEINFHLQLFWLQALGHDSESIATKVCSQNGSK